MLSLEKKCQHKMPGICEKQSQRVNFTSENPDLDF